MEFLVCWQPPRTDTKRTGPVLACFWQEDFEVISVEYVLDGTGFACFLLSSSGGVNGLTLKPP